MQVGVCEYWHVFSGKPRVSSISNLFEEAGSSCVDFEKNHGLRQDVLIARVRELMAYAIVVLDLCRGLMGGPNCRSFSPGRPTIRPREDPLGELRVDVDERRYLDDENTLFTFFAML